MDNGWLRRLSGGRIGKGRPGTLRTADNADVGHLENFIATREGVEAYTEPRTMVTDTTLLLVAGDGEWTRRRVRSPEWAQEFARKHGVACFDAGRVGYPDRMREWNRRQKRPDVPDDLSGL